MIELLVAYLLWEGDAPAQWWAIYVTIILFKIWFTWAKARQMAEMEAETEKIVKKLFEEKWK